MFSMLERNGEKRKVKLSLFKNFLISKTNSLFVKIHNVSTANYT